MILSRTGLLSLDSDQPIWLCAINRKECGQSEGNSKITASFSNDRVQAWHAQHLTSFINFDDNINRLLRRQTLSNMAS